MTGSAARQACLGIAFNPFRPHSGPTQAACYSAIRPVGNGFDIAGLVAGLRLDAIGAAIGPHSTCLPRKSSGEPGT